MTIKTITFDWGDTLAANYGMPYLQTQKRAFTRFAEELRALGCQVPADWVQQVNADIEVDWASSISPIENPEHREIDMKAMFARWLHLAGAREADPHAVQAALNRCTAMLTDTVIPFSESGPTLSLLRARGYRLGVLSHTPWPGDACRSWFDRHGLGGFFDFYSLSSDVGWIKPNPKHFQHTLDQALCAPNEILHVGDHPMRDVEGAKAAGFRTCLRHTERIYPQEQLDACQPDGEIIRLREVVELAARL
jgi:FMN hydrolase / 5-amino-6-(5-phospho-D-ribitylamino)uracil phosphatase